MEGYTRAKHLLDSLCNDMDLQSWTTHENAKGVVVTLRFIDHPDTHRATVKSESETETWIRKKPQAVKRDRERMDQFNKDKMISSVRRSDRLIYSKSAQIDNMRFEDSDSADPCTLSPEIVVTHDELSDQLSLSAPSPEHIGMKTTQADPESPQFSYVPEEPLKCIPMPLSPTFKEIGNDLSIPKPEMIKSPEFETWAKHYLDKSELVPEINRDTLLLHLLKRRPELLFYESFTTNIMCGIHYPVMPTDPHGIGCGISLKNFGTLDEGSRVMYRCFSLNFTKYRRDRDFKKGFGCYYYICGQESCRKSHNNYCKWKEEHFQRIT